MQCGVREKMIRRVGVVEVKCYKCREIGHKYRKCLLWEKKERMAHVMKPQKVHQQEKEPVCLVKGKVQEEERKLRRVEEEEAVHMVRPQEAQQGWRRSSIEKLRKKAKEHYEEDVPEEMQLLELG